MIRIALILLLLATLPARGDDCRLPPLPDGLLMRCMDADSVVIYAPKLREYAVFAVFAVKCPET